MKFIYLSFILISVANSICAQSTPPKDSILVAAPTDSTAKGSVLVADSSGHAKWEQPGYLKTDSTLQFQKTINL